MWQAAALWPTNVSVAVIVERSSAAVNGFHWVNVSFDLELLRRSPSLLLLLLVLLLGYYCYITDVNYLGRPTYLSTDLALPRFFFRFLLFVTYPPSSLNGIQPKSATCSEISAIWKCMSEIWGIPPTNPGPKTTFFRRLRNLTVILTACIFGVKHDTHKQTSALQTTRGLLHRLKMSWTIWTQTA